MFGILFGCLCLLGFIAVWRRRHGWYGHRFGYGCSHHHADGYAGGRRFGWRRRFGMYRVFEELDTSPGQEKAIRGALADLRGAVAALRPQLVEARQSLATSLTSEPFDAALLERTLQGGLAGASNVSPALASAVGRIHDALDADQRKRLARLLDALPYGPAF